MRTSVNLRMDLVNCVLWFVILDTKLKFAERREETVQEIEGLSGKSLPEAIGYQVVVVLMVEVQVLEEDEEAVVVVMAVSSSLAIVHYFSDFITTRVSIETTLDQFKAEVCRQLKQFTPLGISFFFREDGKDLPVDCDYSLRALASLTNNQKKASFDIFLQNVTHLASSSSSRAVSSISNGSSMSSRNNHVVGMFTAKCADSKCVWKFHAASIDERNEMFQVRAYNPEHTCGAGGRNLNQTYSTRFSSSLIEEEVRKNPHKKPRQIADDFQINYGINMEYYQAYHGREKVYETIYGDDVKSYSYLVWYINAIKDTNPGSVIDFQLNPGKQEFKRFFPLAMGLCDSETIDNSDWFLRNLLQVVGDGRLITFHSDRHEGLLQGVPLHYPESFHSFCYYHLKMNLPINGSDPRYTLMLDLFQEATYTLTPENHYKAIQKIRDLNCCRYGRTSNQIAESYNSWIKVHKKMPAFALLDQIRMKNMRIMAKRRVIDDAMMTPLTPEYEGRLESLQDEGLAWKVIVSSPTVFEVLSERTHRVDLEHSTCTCQRWSVKGFPCAHALAAIRKVKREPIDFISPYFTSDYYKRTYLHAIQPIPNYNRLADIDKSNTINPPSVIKRQPGRPQGKRILSKGEKEAKRKINCSNCKETGHNRASCKNPPKFTPLAF
ncbi:uncharacterized protein LOC113325007 [Papaver somniferum]|uniref:uncharacterized protein LOC113325007 n=1 Tax=Papaver somniferum TaxID=3469 RepID=UPI000E70069E|nr:uncharacterized protein LOC113325007 [Papaver somniferum]